MKVLEVVWGTQPVAEKIFKGADVVVIDASKDPISPAEFDIVFCAHILQLVDRQEIPGLLNELVAHVKECGELWVITPSLEWACEQVLKHNFTPPVLSTIYGGKYQHRMGFTLWSLRDLLEQAGMITRQAFQGPYTVKLGDQEIQLPQNTVISVKITPQIDAGDAIS